LKLWKNGAESSLSEADFKVPDNYVMMSHPDIWKNIFRMTDILKIWTNDRIENFKHLNKLNKTNLLGIEQHVKTAFQK
jgi:hypothetical protein